MIACDIFIETETFVHKQFIIPRMSRLGNSLFQMDFNVSLHYLLLVANMIYMMSASPILKQLQDFETNTRQKKTLPTLSRARADDSLGDRMLMQVLQDHMEQLQNATVRMRHKRDVKSDNDIHCPT